LRLQVEEPRVVEGEPTATAEAGVIEKPKPPKPEIITQRQYYENLIKDIQEKGIEPLEEIIKDPLTGWYKKTKKYNDYLKNFHNIARNKNIPVAWAHIDIKALRGMNDRFGHAGADVYIKNIC